MLPPTDFDFSLDLLFDETLNSIQTRFERVPDLQGKAMDQVIEFQRLQLVNAHIDTKIEDWIMSDIENPISITTAETSLSTIFLDEIPTGYPTLISSPFAGLKGSDQVNFDASFLGDYGAFKRITNSELYGLCHHTKIDQFSSNNTLSFITPLKSIDLNNFKNFSLELIQFLHYNREDPNVQHEFTSRFVSFFFCGIYSPRILFGVSTTSFRDIYKLYQNKLIEDYQKPAVDINDAETQIMTPIVVQESGFESPSVLNIEGELKRRKDELATQLRKEQQEKQRKEELTIQLRREQEENERLKKELEQKEKKKRELDTQLRKKQEQEQEQEKQGVLAAIAAQKRKEKSEKERQKRKQEEEAVIAFEKQKELEEIKKQQELKEKKQKERKELESRFQDDEERRRKRKREQLLRSEEELKKKRRLERNEENQKKIQLQLQEEKEEEEKEALTKTATGKKKRGDGSALRQLLAKINAENNAQQKLWGSANDSDEDED